MTTSLSVEALVLTLPPDLPHSANHPPPPTRFPPKLCRMSWLMRQLWEGYMQQCRYPHSPEALYGHRNPIT
ncbi:hypothetical protein Pmani_017188 [Petrolisthes manimaculis]|uniref:Uncharacterized protein n=1 Tax=Petrolisthes manimaculis TaxID=1843537 RepID=A0AAE1PMW9_9EUCA|nr:hypothetical protein Pmani_017188 [Petrolisthes manimaculis]